MNPLHRAIPTAGRLVLGALSLALLSLPLHAETRSLYELSYTPGQDALSTLDVFPAANRLRPGLRNDIHGNSELRVVVRSSQLPSVTMPGFSDQSLETSGAFTRRFGGSGFGYGVDLGLGVHVSGEDPSVSFSEEATRQGPFLVGDFSTGPTYESGNLRSQMRIGVRQPLLGDVDTVRALPRHRGDGGRMAGYVSLDSQLRFSNQAEVSLSVFYDGHGASSASDWPKGLDFRHGDDGVQPMVGFEMGLNF
jgi:hypothetical protein